MNEHLNVSQTPIIFRKILSKNGGMMDGCQLNNDLLQRNMIHFPLCSVGLIEDG